MSKKDGIIKEMKLNLSEIERLGRFLRHGRYAMAKESFKAWSKIGSIVSRLKAARLPKKSYGNLNTQLETLFGLQLTGDERTYSVRLHDNHFSILEWLTHGGGATCSATNPRRLFTAWDKAVNKEAEDKEAEDKEAEETEDKEAETMTMSGKDLVESLSKWFNEFDTATYRGDVDDSELKRIQSVLEDALDLTRELSVPESKSA